jgi:L-xylulose reductase
MSVTISFEGKKVLVTGGGNGIGRALCTKLHSQGAHVYALCRNRDWLDSLESECPGLETICVDLLDWEATRDALSKLEGIDCLVNNAGIGVSETVMETTSDGFDKVMGVNVKAMINVGQIIAQKMMDENRGGSIVNVSSMSSITGTRQSVTYAMSKAATDMLTKAMALELGPKNIRVNCVNPTIIAGTTVAKNLFEDSAAGAMIQTYALARTPLGRFCHMDDVVDAILFLLSDACPMIHGESVFLDGGYRTR